MADTLKQYEQVAGDLVAELERRFPYAAALISGSSGIQISTSGGEQSADEEAPSRGIVFTVYDGAAFVEYASSALAPEVIARAVRHWAAGVTVHAGADALPIIGAGHTTLLGHDRRSFTTPDQAAVESLTLREKIERTREVQRRAAALDPRIVQAQVRYSDASRETIYIGRGRHLAQRVTRTLVAVFIAVTDGAQVRYHYLLRGGTRGADLTQVRDDDLHEVVDVAVRLLAAEKIEPGDYDVVTDPSVSGVIAHECFGHGVELDLFPKGRARAAQYLHERVAAPGVQMYDDPSIAGAYGSYFFDDEGEVARPTQILRDGILVCPISDFSSATFAPGIHTANGRRQDFTRKVYARMSNTFFGSGATAPEQMLAAVERGIYLRNAESGMEDPMGWGIQVTAHYGEEIINGVRTGRLFAPVGISGYVPDLLGSITAVGDDFELSPGFCGKGQKEMVPVSTGGPHLRMRARLG